MKRIRFATLAPAAVGCTEFQPALGRMKDISRPYIMRTKEEAAATAAGW